jgi:addiction module HigA family antidote
MIETKLSYNPNFAVHPGESLKNEMEFLHLSQVELSQRTGLSEKCISQIVNGVAPITSDTAIKLELALGTPAVFWNNLQKNYDLNMTRIALEKRIDDVIQGQDIAFDAGYARAKQEMKEKLLQIVIEDVPHQYQERLLKELKEL